MKSISARPNLFIFSILNDPIPSFFVISRDVAATTNIWPKIIFARTEKEKQTRIDKQWRRREKHEAVRRKRGKLPFRYRTMKQNLRKIGTTKTEIEKAKQTTWTMVAAQLLEQSLLKP